MDFRGGDREEKNAKLQESSGLDQLQGAEQVECFAQDGDMELSSESPKQSHFHKDKWVAGVGQHREQPQRYNWPVTASSLINRIRSFHRLYGPNLPGSQETAGC